MGLTNGAWLWLLTIYRDLVTPGVRILEAQTEREDGHQNGHYMRLRTLQTAANMRRAPLASTVSDRLLNSAGTGHSRAHQLAPMLAGARGAAQGMGYGTRGFLQRCCSTSSGSHGNS